MDIPNVALAKGINVDPSLISRWLNGQRQLKFTSDVLKKLTAFLLDRAVRTNKVDWLKQQMELDGLEFDFTLSENLQMTEMF